MHPSAAVPSHMLTAQLELLDTKLKESEAELFERDSDAQAEVGVGVLLESQLAEKKEQLEQQLKQSQLEKVALSNLVSQCTLRADS